MLSIHDTGVMGYYVNRKLSTSLFALLLYHSVGGLHSCVRQVVGTAVGACTYTILLFSLKLLS